MMTFPEGSTCPLCGSLRVRLCCGALDDDGRAQWHCFNCGDNTKPGAVAHLEATRERWAFSWRWWRLAIARPVPMWSVRRRWQPLFWRLWWRRN